MSRQRGSLVLQIDPQIYESKNLYLGLGVGIVGQFRDSSEQVVIAYVPIRPGFSLAGWRSYLNAHC